MATVILRVIETLRSLKGRVRLIVPYWEVQPWLGELISWCTHPILLESTYLASKDDARFQASLRLHIWSFYGPRSAIDYQHRW